MTPSPTSEHSGGPTSGGLDTQVRPYRPTLRDELLASGSWRLPEPMLAKCGVCQAAVAGRSTRSSPDDAGRTDPSPGGRGARRRLFFQPLAIDRRGHRLSPREPGASRIAPTKPRSLVGEFLRDAAVVHDKRGSNAAPLAVFFVVVDLDDLHATSARQCDCVAVADRVAVVSDDPDLTAGHVNQAKPCHKGAIIQQPAGAASDGASFDRPVAPARMEG
jgi:hypothetical protein